MQANQAMKSAKLSAFKVCFASGSEFPRTIKSYSDWLFLLFYLFSQALMLNLEGIAVLKTVVSIVSLKKNSIVTFNVTVYFDVMDTERYFEFDLL